MIIYTLVVGPIQTNCYVLCDDESKDSIVVDPGDEAGKIIAFIKERQLNIKYIVSTHGHFDHLNAVEELKKEFGVEFYVCADDNYLLDLPTNSFMKMLGYSTVPTHAEKYLKEGDEIIFGKTSLKVIQTPGHTPGGICLYCQNEDKLISGDTLFNGDIGRSDSPGGSAFRLISSIKKKLFVLPDSTQIYPGHGPSSTIGNEKNTPLMKGILKGG